MAPVPAPRALTLPPAISTSGVPTLNWAPALPGPPPGRVVGWHPQRAELLLATPASGLTHLQALGGPGQAPQRLTHGDEPVEQGQWHPRNPGQLVFLRDEGGDEAWRLHVQELLARRTDPRALSPPGWRVRSWAFAPEGTDIVAAIESLDSRLPAPMSRLVRLATDGSPTITLLHEAQGRRLDELRALPRGEWLLRHSVGGARGEWWVHPAQPDAPRRLQPAGTPATSDVHCDKRPDDPPEAEQALWRVGRGRTADFSHLQRLDLRCGHEEALLQGQPADLEAVEAHVRDASLPLAVVHNEDGFSVLRLVPPGELTRLPQAWPAPVAGLPAGVIGGLRWHGERPLLAFHVRSAGSPDRPWVLDLSDPARPRLQPWWPAPESPHPVAQRSLAWRSFDGTRLTALHVAPPERFKGPRPVYVWLHGGPASQSRPGPLSDVERVLVHELGMHVIEPNVRGSSGYGARFQALDDGLLREGAVRDVSALLDLIATRADMDASRVIVAGGSYGGYLSLAVAVAESARLAGAIKRVGITHFVSFLERTQAYRRDNRRVEYGDERDPSMRAFLHRISPLTQADRIRTPLLVVHGRNDPRVPFAEAERIVRAVQANGVPVWFVAADNEGHGFDRPENREVLRLATLAFIREWTKPGLAGPSDD